MHEELRAGILAKVQPFIDPRGYELIELSVQQRMRMTAVSMIVDRYQGKITLDECAEINRHVTEWIENEAMIMGEYTVEVNSPGLDRPLVTLRDFERAVGRQVRFYLASEIYGKREHTGQIESAVGTTIRINTGMESIDIPLTSINKAVPILDW